MYNLFSIKKCLGIDGKKKKKKKRLASFWIYSPPVTTGEGNGSPLQCSCLENPRDGGAWWASVYGVAQSQTQLKRLSSSSSNKNCSFSHSTKSSK